MYTAFMDKETNTRLGWINLFLKVNNAEMVCRRCGISRPTLRKWLRRYESKGMEGLKSQSKRPIRSPRKKLFEQQEQWILYLRRTRNLGARRIQCELKRLHNCSLSLETIHKVLERFQESLLKHKRKPRKGRRRYNRPIPGDRIQMDVCKIAPGLYQYTAIDDCTRMKVLALYSRRTAANSLLFLEKVTEELPFAFQRIQTDRGQEFFANKFQERLMEYEIKFRPIKPGSPHLNGKVERAQKTDLDEFYSTVDLKSPDLEDRLQEWQHHCNWDRPHSSLNGKTPFEKYFELMEKTPLWGEVSAMYDVTKERIRDQNYYFDLQIRKLK